MTRFVITFTDDDKLLPAVKWITMVSGKLSLKGPDVLDEGVKETSLPERRCLLITRLSAEALCCSVGMFFPLNVFAPTTWMFR